MVIILDISVAYRSVSWVWVLFMPKYILKLIVRTWLRCENKEVDINFVKATIGLYYIMLNWIFHTISPNDSYNLTLYIQFLNLIILY